MKDDRGNRPPTAMELQNMLAEGQTTSAQLVEDALSRAKASEDLGIFVSLREDSAMKEAQASDRVRGEKKARSRLEGIPVAIKDNIAIAGESLGCGSKILEGYISPFSSTAVERLRAFGAIPIGVTNMDEFAMGSSTEHSIHGSTRNPWKKECVPGGSSGGSAAAVAAGVVPIALGSDTGGSIRQPASFCGVVGMKPTYGRISRWGLVAFASSLDQIGPIAHTAEDCAIILDCIGGSDSRDSTCLPSRSTDCSGALNAGLENLVIGLPKEYFQSTGVDAEVLEKVYEAVNHLKEAGAELREISLPHTEYAVSAYYLVATAEASSNLARYDGARYGKRSERARSLVDMYEGSRSEGFGEEVKRRIFLGTYVLSAGYYDAYYRKAQKVRTLLRRDFEEAFLECDVIATPTCPEVAFPLGSKLDPLAMYLSDVFTVSANLVGVPGVSLPCGFKEGLPIGLQLLGQAGDDAMPLRIAHEYQKTTNFHCAVPPGMAP